MDSTGREAIALGKGLGFGDIPRELKLSEVERTFYDLDEGGVNVMNDLPVEVLMFAARIVDIAIGELSYELSPNAVLLLADHLNFALERVRKNIRVKMPLAYDVKQLYPLEYKIGQYAVDKARKEFRVGLANDEAVGIAMNLINAKKTPSDRPDPQADFSQMLEEVTEIVEDHFHVMVDRESFNFTRYSPLYILLDFMYDACFYYLPILIGFNAAKKLNIPAPLGAYIGCILLAPDFMQMVTDGTEFTILGFKVIMNNYSQTLLPIVVSVAFLALVYKLIAKVIPDALTTIFTPFLTVLLSTPIILLWLAPVGTYLSNMISGALIWISTHTGFFGTAFIGAIWEFLVMTGMHMVVGMPFMMDFFTVGYQSGAIMGANCATWACWGVALGAFFRLRNKQAKSTALGFFVSGAIGGVTEPALYGLCFQYRRCFISLMIGGAVGGAWMGITNVLSYMMATSNFLNVLSFTGGTTANLVNGIIGCLLSLVVTTVATYFIGFTKEDLKA